MKVLVACEESQRVCRAFRDTGHEAMSCDILKTSGKHEEWHIQGNVLDWIQKEDGRIWDMMIAHPPCTYLCNSGVSWLWRQEERWEHLCEAAGFFYKLWNAPVDKICIENPIPHKYGSLPKYSQIIHPWQFGHMEQKPTCLWLKNLPPLKETNNVYDEMKKLPANKRQRIHYMAPSATRQQERSKTYPGIAAAMAEQWGKQEQHP
jgi:hypothetical protein